MAQVTVAINKNELFPASNEIMGVALKAWLTLSQRVYENYDPKAHATALTAIKQIVQVVIKKVDKALKHILSLKGQPVDQDAKI